MSVLVLSHRQVRELLPVSECIGVMRHALEALALGRMHQPLRTIFRPQGASLLLGLMPAYASEPDAAFGLKAIAVFPGNPARGKDSHQGAVMLFDATEGRLVAMMDASALTAIRTAAVSAVATDLLARPDASNLAIVGAGVQARGHIEAIACVRDLRRVRVADRGGASARRLSEEMGSSVGVPVEVAATVESAVRDADIVVTVTSSSEPVVRRDWIRDGAHVNAVGASVATAREIDTATMAAARLFVDRRESALHESGDYLLAAREGAIGPQDILAEIGEVLVGAKPGRTDPTEITLFESLGLGVEDLAAAQHVHRRAVANGAGVTVDF